MFLYEKFQDLCFNCGVIGHEQRVCKKARANSVISSAIARYGAKMSVLPAKPLDVILKEMERGKKENVYAKRYGNKL